MSSEDISQSQAPSTGAGVPSIISADLKIVGDLHSNGDLQIDGAVEGDIASRSLTVGESAVVRGSLVAENVRVYGAVSGQIKANSVTLTKTAKVEGNVLYRALSVESGAILTGNVSRLDRVMGSGARPGTAAKPAPAAPDEKTDELLTASTPRDRPDSEGGLRPPPPRQWPRAGRGAASSPQGARATSPPCPW